MSFIIEKEPSTTITAKEALKTAIDSTKKPQPWDSEEEQERKKADLADKICQVLGSGYYTNKNIADALADILTESPTINTTITPGEWD